MSAKKRIEITVEIDRVWLIQQRQSFTPILCTVCAEPAEMVTVSAAAAVAGVDACTIYQWVAAESLHYTETPIGLLLICLNSLPK